VNLRVRRFRLGASLLLPVLLASAGAPLFPQEARKTKVVLLGTGAPAPNPERSGPATAIVVNNTAYLIDAGPGLVRRANAAFLNGVQALEPTRLRVVFLTHLHSDHTLGYPDLIFTPLDGWPARSS
jgi:glyoxylase-like metal-dependent hydrolase (beta-lactamase superfamily II)